MGFKIDDFGSWKRGSAGKEAFDFARASQVFKLFDGDNIYRYTEQNKKLTIQRVMNEVKVFEDIVKENYEFKKKAKALIEQAQSEDVMINLKNISREMFPSGETYREFMKAILKLQEMNGGNNNG